jgi:predicted cobalt transporter CbtA
VGGMVAAVYGVRWANGSGSAISQRVPRYVLVAAVYIAFAVVIGLLIPGNPDPTPVPVELLQQFRTLTVIGHFLLWLLLAVGVAGALMWYRRSARGGTGAAPREMAQTRS